MRFSTSTPDEIYNSVGQALSWWEASEDVILGLYKTLTGTTEPAKLVSYIKATRNPRSQMLDAALKKYASDFEDGELSKVLEAVDGLKALVERRNQITHGHCSTHKRVEDDVVIMDGTFLMPAWNEIGPGERDFRYALTAEDIRAFEKDVREFRWSIHEVATKLMMRKFAAQQLQAAAQAQAAFASLSSDKT